MGQQKPEMGQQPRQKPGMGLDGPAAEAEAWDGPSGASFASGGMLGSLPLPRLAASAAAPSAASALCLGFRSCRPVRSGHRMTEHSRVCG